MLQKVILFLSFLFIPFSHVSVDRMAVPASDSPTPVSELAAGEQLFEEMELGGIVNFIAFRQAVAGYNRIKEKSKPILTLIDFSKPSTEKRFFVFDMETDESVVGTMPLLFPTKTALIKVHWDFISLKTLTKAETATHSS